MKNLLLLLLLTISSFIYSQSHSYYFYNDGDWSMSPKESTSILIHVVEVDSLTEIYFQNYGAPEEYYYNILNQIQNHLPELACFDKKSYDKGRILYPGHNGDHVRYIGNQYDVSVPYILSYLKTIL